METRLDFHTLTFTLILFAAASLSSLAPRARAEDRAAQQRHEHTRAKAIAAMHELDRTGAVLTFDFVSWGGGGSVAWHCSEVYARTAAGWRIVQTHWSLPTASAT